jgi:hypothetical protein
MVLSPFVSGVTPWISLYEDLGVNSCTFSYPYFCIYLFQDPSYPATSTTGFFRERQRGTGKGRGNWGFCVV